MRPDCRVDSVDSTARVGSGNTTPRWLWEGFYVKAEGTTGDIWKGVWGSKEVLCWMFLEKNLVGR